MRHRALRTENGSNMKTHSNSLVISELQENQSLSPAQRKFNLALEKIEKQKAALAEWQQTDDLCKQSIAYKFLPLRQELINEQIQQAIFFDDCLTRYKFTKIQKEKLTYLICNLCNELVEQTDDPALLALYQRYIEDDKDDLRTKEEEIEIKAAMRDSFRKEFGVELDENVDINDPEALMHVIFEQQFKQQHENNPPKQRKKTAKQEAKEAKEREEAQTAQQSIQNIYRQLVKTLHPDRETDIEEKERKTILMQAITVAYEEKNLIKLLELQLQETQTSHQLHQLSDDKIKPFIKLLEQQLQQLKTETADIENHYKMILNMTFFDRITPKRLHALIKEDIRRLDMQLKQTKSNNHGFKIDINYLKAWLKNLDSQYYWD